MVTVVDGGDVIQDDEGETAEECEEDFLDDDQFLLSVDGDVFGDDNNVEEADDVPAVDEVLHATVENSENRLEDGASTIPGSISDIRYDRHKPKWWKQRVGRYVTKPQRRAMISMQEYRLQKSPYGSKLEFNTIFQHHNHHKFEQHPPPIVWMELGFGKGDNLLCLAQNHPDTCFVGVEVHPSSVAICLQRIQGVLEHNQHWTGYQLYQPTLDPFEKESSNKPEDDNPVVASSEYSPRLSTEDDDETIPLLQNVRIYGGDGIVLLESCVSTHSIHTILITFPDPFPSDKPHRIIQVHTIDIMVRCLIPNRGRLCLATDHAEFFEWAHQVVDEWNRTKDTTLSEDDESNAGTCRYSHHRSTVLVPVNIPRSEWLPVVSRYERKGWEEGRKTLLKCWETTTQGKEQVVASEA